MDPRAWSDDNGTAYVALMAASWLGVALLISYTVLKIVGTPFEPIDPVYVVALTTIFYSVARGHTKSKRNEIGA
ncbi:hypothetical protein [Halorarum halobium]|uniref:hypothetical protein n=1 Tax=Halorarum halobium TaxID=3075121 RepID=UPI0028AFD91E|nr:hypothetical protein [Halobaculum sp. XH14]